MFNRRPFLVTPWSVWINPHLKIRYRFIKFYLEHGMDDQGRIRTQIVDEIDREYWVRLKPWQHRMLSRRVGHWYI